MWFYPYSPSADNLPESEWTTDELRALHEEDLFYNTSTTDEDGGKAWRYVYDEATGTYMWELVTDAETIKALEKAAEAQKTADEVTEHLNEIVADGILSSLEKKEVLKEWQEISSEYERNVDTAENFGLEESSDELLLAYKDAYMTLGRFMNDGDEWDGVSIPSWLADLTTNQVIDAAAYRSIWVNYYNAERKFLNWLSTIAKDKADDARDEADKANGQIAEIVSDGILSALEKKEVLKEWVSIVTSYSTNIDNANTHSVSTSVYTSSYLALGTYLNGGTTWDGTSTPLWLSELDKNQDIDATDYRNAWVNYYSSEVDLLKAISDKIKDDADEAQKTADEKKRVFGSQPTPPYDIGDIWTNASYGTLYDDDVLVCVNPKAEGQSFSINDWQPVSYGTTSIIKKLDDQIVLEVANREDAFDEVVARLDLYVTYDDLGNPYSGIEISADLIDLSGTITIYDLSNSLYNTITGKADSSELAALEDEIANSVSSLNGKVSSLQTEVSAKASLTALNQAIQDLEDQLEGKVDGEVDTNLGKAVIGGYTLIVNGYIQTQFIKTEDLVLERLKATDGTFTYSLDSNGFAIKNEDVTLAKLNLYNNSGYFMMSNGSEYFTMDASSLMYAADEGICYIAGSGLSLSYGAHISGLAVNTKSTSLIGENGFVVASSNVTFPSPSSYEGRIVFLKPNGKTITVSNCVKSGDSTASTLSYSGNNARIFVSDGTYWYEFEC